MKVTKERSRTILADLEGFLQELLIARGANKRIKIRKDLAHVFLFSLPYFLDYNQNQDSEV